MSRALLLIAEWAFRLATRSRPVPGVNTFLLAVHRHRGRALTLDDGTLVQPGALVGELHFWNERIAAGYGATPAGQLGWRFQRDLLADLRRLASFDLTGGLPHGLVAFYGVSPFAHAARRFGFSYIALPSSAALRLVTAWQRMLGRVFRPAGRQRAAPRLAGSCWLSRRLLQERYGG